MNEIELGHSLYSTGDYAGAESEFLSALRADPGNIAAAFGLGKTYQVCSRLDDAILCYRHAINLDPGHAGAHCNLGGVLWMSGRLDDAEAELREAIRLVPGYAEAHNNLGVVRFCQGDDIAAEDCFRMALDSCPDRHDWHVNLGMSLNRRGDLTRGLAEYSWLWRCDSPVNPYELHSHDIWDGSPLDGRTILLNGEQGLGDTIHLVRFASSPILEGGRVILECRRPLARIMATCSGIDQVFGRGDVLPRFDVQVPLFALIGLTSTTIDTIPGRVPYLSADPARVEQWRRRLDEVCSGLRVGIHWRGDPSNHRDHDRSFPLSLFGPLSRIDGVTIVSIQKGSGEELRTRPFPIIDFDDEVDPGMATFDDTPALIANLDLVISADTCVAHTAGALGVPVWIALPYSPDWRWFRDRTDSPWYPTARLFRQSKLGDWPGVFEEMAQAIKGLIQ